MSDINTLTELIVSRENEAERGIHFILSHDKEIFVPYQELYHTALRLLYSLQQSGYRPGDKVIFQIDDNQRFVYSFWACILGGMIPVPVTTGTNDEHKLKLFKIWNVLGVPRMIASADFVEKLRVYAENNDLGEQMETILQRVTYVEEAIQTEKEGEISYPQRNDLAFIQFSSGSTGNPKGVMITHGNVLTNLSAVLRWSHIGSDDVSLNWMPLTHDMGLIGTHIKDIIACIDQFNIQTSLFVRRPSLWLQKASEHRVTLLYSPNFGYKHFLKFYNEKEPKDWDLSAVRLIYNGAEPISLSLCNEFLEKMAVYGLKKSAMHPVYGLAEGTIAVAFPNPGEEFMFHVLDRNHLGIGETVRDTFKDDRNAVVFMDVGYPIYDCYARICDEDNNDLGENKIGYIELSGGNITSGYYNNKEATEKAITKDGWLNTGDLGFMRNKRLTITGRAKDVIFVSGQNYYSQDIERIAEGADGIELGKVVAVGVFNKELGSDELILFVMFKQKPEKFVPIAVDLKRIVNERLGIEVAEVIPIKSIPKTTSGKIQHFKLSESYARGDYELIRQELHALMAEEFEKREIVLPQTQTEIGLAEIFSEILNIGTVSIHDDFFRLGGDSLKITQLLSRIRDTFGVVLTQTEFFEHPTVGELSAIVDQRVCGSKTRGDKIAASPEIYGRAPLSFAQQRLWFLDRLNLQSPQYNLYAGLVLRGALDQDALVKSLNMVLKRHHVLQSRFIEENGQPVQIFEPNAQITLETVDLAGAAQADRRKRAMEIAKSLAKMPFRLDIAPLMRGKLLCIDQNEHMLVLAAHHIVFDGWSFGVLMRELGSYYDALASGSAQALPELEIQYADYAVWQKEQAQNGALLRQIQYWKKQLAGNLPVLELPTDRPRPLSQTYNGKKITGAVPNDLLQKLKLCAQKENATLFMVLFAAFNVLLYKYTGQADILLGSPIANRNRKDIEGLIGFFTNNIVLRTTFSGDMDFSALVQAVKKETLEAYSNQDVPFEKLVEELHVERDMSKNPLFQVLFGMQITPLPTKVFSELNVSTVDIDGGFSRFDLSLDVREAGEGLALDFEYNTDLFNDDTVIRMAGQYNNLLAQIADAPQKRLKQIEVLTQEDKNILNALNDTAEEYKNVTNWTGLFEKQAAKTPDAVAAICRGEQITYRELDADSNKLAHYLLERGVGAESVVGIYLERSLRMLTALLAAHKAGAAYLPMDPIFPRERLQYMLEDAQVKLILSEKALADSLPAHNAQLLCLDTEWDEVSLRSGEKIETKTAGDNLAYLIYTSGSTGKPKGVQIEQHALTNFLQSMADKTGICQKDTLLAVTTLSFDIAGLELYLPLICGAKIVIAARDEVIDGERLAQIIKEQNITVMQATPATWRLLIEAGWNGTNGLSALCGGEAVSRELANQLLDRCGAVFNVYGPTETTIWSTIEKIESHTGTVLIGRPIANTQVYVLDGEMNRVPVGVPGELYIGGDGLARGYMHLSGLTAEKFIPDPFCGKEGARLYKTGDLVKCTPDGKLECIGRIDNQVKIRGYRIELGEIEALLEQSPEVKTCIVADKELIPGEKSLVAYIIPAAANGQVELLTDELKKSLKEKLPAYMIPSAFVGMEAFPLTPNGKIDRRALPVPHRNSKNSGTGASRQNGNLEKDITSIWCEVLKIDEVGPNQNFFDVGGHSLLLAQVRSKIEKELHRDISMMDLFKYPTVASLADYLRGGENPVTQTAPKTQAPSRNHDIAVIGLSGRFPGAKNIDEFWKNLSSGTESIARFTDEQILAEGVSPEMLKKPGYVKAGGVIEDIDRFDANFFGYNPREAELLDPQQRIFLEEAWKALENAGYDSERFPGLIGIYGSVGMNAYARNLNELYASKGIAGDYQIMTGNDKDFLATRAAYKMGLEGPAVTVQSACSSSLVAVHLACQSLLNSECDMALAGGVCVRIPQKAGYLYQEGMILSPDGCCRAFDEKAQGTVGGNGAGVVVLKRLDDAVRDGDHISAVIKGSAINNDGMRKVGYTAPAIDGQAKAIAAAQAKAGVDPATITYIEAHGTGTPLGDPIEMEALTKVFREKTAKKGYCAVGSVKTNIGHLDAASGVTGFMKTVLSLKNRMLPPSLHFEKPNPKIDFENSPFYVNTTLKKWEGAAPLHAGVSSFGIGGTNVHVVLEEAPVCESELASNTPCILVFSAKDQNALNRMTEDFYSYLKEHSEICMQDAAYTLQLGRRAFACRKYLVCTSAKDALEAFEHRNDPQSRFVDNTGMNRQPEQAPAAEIENLSPQELGDRWLRQENIDWSRLYRNQKRRRLPLPTYPFNGQSYWVKKQVSVSNTPKQPDTAKRADLSDWFYTPVFKQALIDTVPEIDIGDSVLVLHERGTFSQALISRMTERGLSVTDALAGNGYQAINSNAYTFDPQNPEHYENILKTIAVKDQKTLRIVNLLGITQTAARPGSPNSVDGAKQLFYSMIFLAQAVGKLSLKSPVQILAVTNNAQNIFGEPELYPEKALHLGACRVIPREYPNIRCGSVDIVVPAPNSGEEQALLDCLIDETFSAAKETLAAYRGQTRWEQEYENIPLQAGGRTTVSLRQKGVYLITGGLGGIGLTMAAYLAKEVGAKLVLTGRSRFPDAAQWDAWLVEHGNKDAVSQKIVKLKEILDLGAEVLICQADATDPVELQNLRDTIKEKFGTINGVIHAAGRPGGGMIQLKKKENAEQVFAPKLEGTLALYKAFADCGLDFMLVCSSLNAVTGGFGQCDYSGANAFLDAFAQAHRNEKTKVLAIDWDRWPGVGMASGSRVSAQEVHPLLGRCVADTAQRTVYMNRLSPEKDWVLSEHKVMAVPTIAGTTYLEMARAALEELTGTGTADIREVIFLNPMAVKPGESRTVFTVLNKKDNGFTFSIISLSDDDSVYMEHARGTVTPFKTDNAKRCELALLKEKCAAKRIFPSEELPTISEEFISFGGRWRSLTGVCAGDGEALAEAVLNQEYVQDLQTYKLHPAVLDVATGVIRLTAGGNYLPLSYNSLRQYKALTGHIFSHVTFGKDYIPAAQTITCDIEILSDTGELLAEIDRFSMKKIDRALGVGAKPSARSAQYEYLSKAKREADGDKANVLNEGITAEEGIQALDRILKGCRYPQVIVSTKELSAAIAQADYTGSRSAVGNPDAGEEEQEKHPRPELETEYVPPRNEAERKLSALWQNILGIEKIGIYDEFFALGGDSLLLIQLHSKLKESFTTDIAIVDLYKFNTVALLAKHLQGGDKEDAKPNFEKVNSRANKQLELLRKKKQMMQRKKG